MKNARGQLTAILIAVMTLYVGAEASQVIDNFEYANDAIYKLSGRYEMKPAQLQPLI